MIEDAKVALFLASRSITRANRATLIVTITIMTLAVINLLIVPAILDGMDFKSQIQIVEKTRGHVVIEPKEDLTEIKNVNSILKTLHAFPEVLGASAEYEYPATIFLENRSSTTSIIFVDPLEEKTVSDVHKFIVEGDFLSKDSKQEIVIGKEIAGRFGHIFEDFSIGEAFVDDEITVIFTNGLEKNYRIKGIFDSHFYEADKMALISDIELKKNFDLENVATRIIIRLNNDYSEKEFIKKLTSIGLGQDIYKSRERGGIVLTKTFFILKIVMAVISLMVSMVTLFIITYINAFNKKKLIAILKSTGVRKRIIIASYILQAFFFAAIGVFLGIIILYFILKPYFLANPLEMPFGFSSLLIKPSLVILYSIGFLISAIIAGFIPSYQIAKQNIIDAMR